MPSAVLRATVDSFVLGGGREHDPYRPRPACLIRKRGDDHVQAKQPRDQAGHRKTIRHANTIGALERMAGIGPDTESRNAFWMPFRPLPGGQGLDAGVAELKRRIRLAAQGGSK
jgi:hypothetical protein